MMILLRHGAFDIWFVLCFLVAMVARSKGRSVIGYFLLAFLLSPLVGFIVVAIVPKIEVAFHHQILVIQDNKAASA